MKNTNNNELPRICMFCEHCIPINDKENVLCSKKGIVNMEYSCKKFFYDPLKRVPRPQPPLPKLNKEDLLL
ncbi:MAG: hypothetical protein E7623_00045 [Ruminococcaceae bacterium]|nr:hypothetical protein [Oscillospiraceae bacterium]